MFVMSVCPNSTSLLGVFAQQLWIEKISIRKCSFIFLLHLRCTHKSNSTFLNLCPIVQPRININYIFFIINYIFFIVYWVAFQIKYSQPHLILHIILLLLFSLLSKIILYIIIFLKISHFQQSKIIRFQNSKKKRRKSLLLIHYNRFFTTYVHQHNNMFHFLQLRCLSALKGLLSTAIAEKTCLHKKINLLEDDIYFPLFIFVRQLTTAAAPGSSCCSLNPNRQQHFSNNNIV